MKKRVFFAKLNSNAFPFFFVSFHEVLHLHSSSDETVLHSSVLGQLRLRPKDLYLTHWSFRMSQPQQNWGQSLQYRPTLERIARREGQATFEEVIGAMDKLVTLVEKGVPSRELTYPIPAGTFESMMFLFPFGGICDRSVEDTKAPKRIGWLFSHKTQLVHG